MSEKPILFSGPMVRALLDGRKTQTRRVVKPQPVKFDEPWPNSQSHNCWHDIEAAPDYHGKCGNIPYAKGMRLWVRETFQKSPDGIVYRATESDAGMGEPDDEPVWRPSIFMPRTASRITLEITGVRVERLQEITAADALAEGVTVTEAHQKTSQLFRELRPDLPWVSPAQQAYCELWDSINAKRNNGIYAWRNNPYVWRIEFPPISREAGK